MKKLLYLVFAIFVLISCENNQTKIQNDKKESYRNFTPEYAKGFKIEYFSDRKVVTVFNPWNENKIYFKYIITEKNDSSVGANEKTVIISPSMLERVAVLSGPQISMFYELNLQNSIKAVENKNIIFNPDILKRIENKEIYQTGGFNLFNYELCINKKLTAVFTTAWDKINENFKKISDAGIPVIYSLDWQETSPLGRAEWIKFIAAFYNKEKLADSVFNAVKTEYLKYKKLAEQSSEKPKVINGNIYNGTWYVAGGKSYLAKLFNDANTLYPYIDDNHTGSIPLSFESVFLKAGDAEYWFTSSNGNVSFLENDKRYSKLKAYQNGNIYFNTKRINSSGGNDYWETGSVHPEFILKDVIKITHPEILPDYNLMFFTKKK